MRAEFGDYTNGGEWYANVTFALTDPNPTANEIKAISDEIDVRTEERAGKLKV